MRLRSFQLAALLICAATFPGGVRATEVSHPVEFHGCCDASAVVALDEDHFVIGSDEDSILRIYNRSQTNAPVWQRDFSGFLQLARKAPETDLEGAARIGDVIYWITSHSRNAEGRERPNRQRLFATRIVKTPAGFELNPAGQPCQTLLAALVAEPRLAAFKLEEAARLSPEQAGALNIEGLAATPSGGLLIAFRSPVPAGKALIVPLENPADVIEGKAPRFGEPVQLDLNGRGVRDLTFDGGRYFLIAGGVANKGKFSLFEWNGPGSAPVLKGIEFGKLSPEGLAVAGANAAAELLCTSDDSSRRIDDCDCKDLPEPVKRRFRMVTLRPKGT